MSAMDRGRGIARSMIVLAAAGAAMPEAAWAQLPGRSTAAKPPASAAALPAGLPKPAGAQPEAPGLVEVRVPINTTDPIAKINGEIITREQLASEAVARKGQEILETMISKKLIEQALRERKMEVTAAEIDQEIDSVAMRMAGVTRDVWLRTLDKERGISPAQYARDIIYPALALRKLSEGRVQVTEKDLQDAFEANYGPRLRCRLIMTDQVSKAKEIWEELRKNPASFERLAKERSMDSSTRALGGMLPEPMARHAQPATVSDAAFRQLVDGDLADSSAAKPKDGDFTGPIQMDEFAWVIIKREGVDGGNTTKKLTDPDVRQILTAQMKDVKLKEKMNEVFKEMIESASIENLLTGQVKKANEEKDPDFAANLDGKVQRMSVAGETKPVAPSNGKPVPQAATSPAGASRPPAGVPADAARAASSFRETVKSAPPGQAAPRR